jgi:hypothetical protein
MAARELGSLSLADALDLTLLIREQGRNRYERAALRWLQRFIRERQPSLSQLALAVTALSDLQGAGESSLRELVKR